MCDVLFTHINGLTKDLYECSHYDAKQTEQNNQLFIERLEKEIKVHVRMEREQEEQILRLEKEAKELREELQKNKEVARVVPSNLDADGYQ